METTQEVTFASAAQASVATIHGSSMNNGTIYHPKRKRVRRNGYQRRRFGNDDDYSDTDDDGDDSKIINVGLKTDPNEREEQLELENRPSTEHMPIAAAGNTASGVKTDPNERDDQDQNDTESTKKPVISAVADAAAIDASTTTSITVNPIYDVDENDSNDVIIIGDESTYPVRKSQIPHIVDLIDDTDTTKTLRNKSTFNTNSNKSDSDIIISIDETESTGSADGNDVKIVSEQHGSNRRKRKLQVTKDNPILILEHEDNVRNVTMTTATTTSHPKNIVSVDAVASPPVSDPESQVAEMFPNIDRKEIEAQFKLYNGNMEYVVNAMLKFKPKGIAESASTAKDGTNSTPVANTTAALPLESYDFMSIRSFEPSQQYIIDAQKQLLYDFPFLSSHGARSILKNQTCHYHYAICYDTIFQTILQTATTQLEATPSGTANTTLMMVSSPTIKKAAIKSPTKRKKTIYPSPKKRRATIGPSTTSTAATTSSTTTKTTSTITVAALAINAVMERIKGCGYATDTTSNTIANDNSDDVEQTKRKVQYESIVRAFTGRLDLNPKSLDQILLVPSIQQLMTNNTNNTTPTVSALLKNPRTVGTFVHLGFDSRNSAATNSFVAAPTTDDPILLFEKQYVYEKMNDWLITTKMKIDRYEKQQFAQRTGTGVECACCYDTYHWDDIVSCQRNTATATTGGKVSTNPNDTLVVVDDDDSQKQHEEQELQQQLAPPHLFCSDCVCRMMESLLYSQGNLGYDPLTKELALELKCFHSDGCSSTFHKSYLDKILPKKLQKKLDEIQIQLSIQKAGIFSLLHSCPKCYFQAEVPSTQNIFTCPSCQYESCRLCNLPSHIPYRCEEVQKDIVETKGRIVVEEAISNTKIRTCPKCYTNFIKSDGCNKVRCSCGIFICYICRIQIKDYKHFCQVPHCTHKDMCNLCPLHTSSEQDEEIQRMRQAAVSAVQTISSDVQIDIDKLLKE